MIFIQQSFCILFKSLYAFPLGMRCTSIEIYDVNNGICQGKQYQNTSETKNPYEQFEELKTLKNNFYQEIIFCKNIGMGLVVLWCRWNYTLFGKMVQFSFN